MSDESMKRGTRQTTTRTVNTTRNATGSGNTQKGTAQNTSRATTQNTTKPAGQSATKSSGQNASRTNVTNTYTTTQVEKPKKPTAEDIAYALKTPEAQAMMKEMVAQMVEAQKKEQPVQIVTQKEEMVTLLYMGAVAEGSMVPLNDKLGEIQGRGGTRDIPKREFLQNLTPSVLRRLKDRRLIVIDGLTDDERERYGLNYTDGELVSSKIYYKLLDMNERQVANIFSSACYKHKQLIASLYAEEYNKGNPKINRIQIERLNKLSKSADKDGMFTAILKDMARKMADSDDNEEENEI